MWLALSFPGKSLTFLEVILRLIIYLVPMTRAPSSLFSGLYLGLRVAGWQPPGSTSEVEGNLMLCSSPSNSQISYGLLCPLPVPSSLMWTLVWWLHKPRPKCFRWPIRKWVIMPSLCTFALTLAFFTRSCQNSMGPFICIHRNSPVLITPETMCFLCSIKYFSYAVHSLNTQINNARYGNRKKGETACPRPLMTPNQVHSIYHPLLDHTLLHCFECSWFFQWSHIELENDYSFRTFILILANLMASWIFFFLLLLEGWWVLETWSRTLFYTWGANTWILQ